MLARIRVLVNSFHTCESSNLLSIKNDNYVFRDNEIIDANPILKEELLQLYNDEDNIILHKDEV